MTTNSNLNDFHYAYRFNSEDYNVLPENDILKIVFHNKEYSSLLWERHIDESSTHYKKSCIKRERLEKFLSDCGWGNKGNEEKTQNVLKELASEDTDIIIFWSKYCSVKTTWGIFCKYWNDFCYPSDDGNIILYSNQVLIYDEDILYKLKDYQTTVN